jgi:hypothetical protein
MLWIVLILIGALFLGSRIRAAAEKAREEDKRP